MSMSSLCESKTLTPMDAGLGHLTGRGEGNASGQYPNVLLNCICVLCIHLLLWEEDALQKENGE